MRISARPLATLLLGVGVATCSDTPIAAVKQGPGPNSRGGFGRVALASNFSKTANFAAANADLFGISYDSVHIQIRGTPDTTLIVKDTVIHFTRTSADTSIDLLVPVQADGQKFDAAMAYQSATGQVFFSGHVVVQSYPPSGSPPPNQAQITINYVGPGSRVAHIVVAPKTVSLLATQTTPFSVTAVDSAGASTPAPPVDWSSSNPNVGTVSSSGLFTPTGLRGTTTVTATTPTGLSDNASVNITLPASRITLVSGGGQTGKIGSTLASPAVVQVSAADGVGVANVSVVFSAPAGGSVSPTSATTDAGGRASATLRLGSAAGPQGFAASSAGFSVGINETATAGDPAAIAAVSGGGQTDTVGHALHSPLVVHVSDQFGNPVSGATVAWARTGSGSLSAATSITGADGNASVNYTLGTNVGSETISASVAGVSGSVSFTETAVAAAPSNIAVVSGSGQSGTVNRALAAPFVVRVTDDAGNPSAGATVTWSATSGTIAPTSTTTDATGQTSATLTLPRTVGSIGVSASLSNGHSANFSASANPGIIASLSWRVQPSNVTAGVAIAPAMQIAAVDSFGNLSTTSTLPITLALRGGSGATLGGTITRSPSGGVATFGDITVNRAANGYTLVASMTTPAISSPSAAFNVTAASAASVAVSAGDNQSATVNTAVAAAPAVVVRDSLGNPIVGLAVTFTPASGSGSVAPSGGTVSTNALGIAALTSWTLGQTAGAQSLVASAPGLSSVTFHATAQAGAASALKITTQPSASVTSGQVLAQQPVIQVVDQFGNAAPAGTMHVVVAATGGSLHGTTDVVANPTTGVATFTDLKITGSGNVTLTFSAPGTSSVTSNAIAVGSAGPTQLVLVPSSTTSFTFTAGSPPSLPVVKAADASGAGVAGVPIHVSVAFASTTVGVKDTVTGADGTVGAPANVIPTKAGTYSVVLTSSAISGASAAFSITVNAAAAAKLAFTTQPSNVVAGVSINPAVVVQVQDAFGNVVSGATNSVTLASSPSVTLGGTATAAAVSGNATFAAVSVPTVGTYTLSASATGLTSATSSSFAVTSPTAASINLSSASGLTITAGNVLSNPPTATVLDGASSPVVGASVTLTVKQGTATIGSRAAETDALGHVSFGILTTTDLPTAVGTYTITATSGSVSSSAVNLTVNAGAASKIKLSPTNSGPPAGAEISIIASVTDAFGNTASDAGSRSLSWSSTAGSFDGDAVLRNMSNGIGSGLFVSPSSIGTSRVTVTDQSTSPLASGSVDIATVSGGLQLAVSGSAPASSGVAGSSVGAPAVKATRSDGVTPVSGVTVKFTVATGGGKVKLTSGSTGVDAISEQTDNSGVTSIAAWTLGSAPGSNSLQITAAGSSNSITHTSTATAGSATTMAAFNGTSYSGTAGVTAVNPPGILVTDANGNGVQNVTIHLVTTVANTNTVLRTDDVATNASGKIDLSGFFTTSAGSYTTVATNSALSGSGLTFSVTINPASATKLAFGTQPSNVNATSAISPAVTVQVQDQFGNVVTSSSASIALALHTAGGATLTGGTATAASSGVATFSSLAVDLAGTYQLDASSGGLTAATSSSFTVTSGSVHSLQIVSSLGSSISNDAVFSPDIQVKALDAGGNPLPNVAIDAGVDNAGTFDRRPSAGRLPPGPATPSTMFFTLPTFSGSQATTNSSGIATFSSVKMRGAVQTFRLLFTAHGTSVNVHSGNISLTHGAAKKATCSVTPPGHVRLGHVLSIAPKFHVVDIDDNIVDNTPVQFDLSAGSVGATNVTTDASGDATGSSWTVSNTAGTHTIEVHGVDGTISTKCSTIAAAADHIKITGSIANKHNGDAIESLDATVVDLNDNALEDETFTIAVAGDAASGYSGTLDGTTSHSSNGQGKATFGDLKVNANAHSAVKLDFSVAALGVSGSTNSFNVDVGSQENLKIVGASSVSGFALQTSDLLDNTPTVQLKDHGSHNDVQTSGTTITWSFVNCTASTPPSFVSGATSPTDNSGKATSPLFNLGFSGTCTLRATLGSATADFVLTVNPGF